MRLYFWKSPAGNFGDDLNRWLWPRVFPGLFDSDRGPLFIGIGSVLCARIINGLPQGRKIVFGAGARRLGDTAIDATGLDFRFVRGPLTSAAFRLEPSKALADPALLTRRYFDYTAVAKRFAVGFMPYFETASDGIWSEVCARAGVEYIDPRWPVDRVLESIAGCDRLITEAMHGAVIADAFRVPWLRVVSFATAWEGETTSAFKWLDWTATLQLDATPVTLPRLRMLKHAGAGPAKKIREIADAIRCLIGRATVTGRIRSSRDSTAYTLSNEMNVRRLESRIVEEIERLKEELAPVGSE